jgi:CheY-like chemotaxis protein
MRGECQRRKPAPAGAVRVRKPGILIADDTALILTLLKFELESRRFAVWLAVDGDDALDLYRKHRHEIDLVLLDVQMPGLDGPHTLDALRRLNPNVVACFMSAKRSPSQEEELFDRGAAWVFRKPFRLAEVADFLQGMASNLDSLRMARDRQTPAERETQAGRNDKNRGSPGKPTLRSPE